MFFKCSSVILVGRGVITIKIQANRVYVFPISLDSCFKCKFIMCKEREKNRRKIFVVVHVCQNPKRNNKKKHILILFAVNVIQLDAKN